MAADVRPARASDVDALFAIENTAFQTDRLSRRSFRRLIGRQSAAVLVAEVGGRIAGYCIVLFRAGASAARLYSISTASGMTGRGIGRVLLAAAERATREQKRRSLRLEVREDNERAISLYRSAGFRPVGRKPEYYQDGMAALRMEKDLVADRAAYVSLAARNEPTPRRAPL